MVVVLELLLLMWGPVPAETDTRVDVLELVDLWVVLVPAYHAALFCVLDQVCVVTFLFDRFPRDAHQNSPDHLL